MKLKVRFRLEKGAFGFQRLDLCVCCHLMGELLSSDDDMGRDENQFLFEFLAVVIMTRREE